MASRTASPQQDKPSLRITRRYPAEYGLRDDQLFGAERWERQMFYPLLQSKREYSALKFGGRIYSDE